MTTVLAGLALGFAVAAGFGRSARARCVPPPPSPGIAVGAFGALFLVRGALAVL